MSDIIAAVGGTGQEVASACLRLSHMIGRSIPKIFIFDSDDSGRGEQEKENMEAPQTRSEVLTDLGLFFKSIIGEDPIIKLSPLNPQVKISQLKSLFYQNQILDREESDVLSLLFTDDQLNKKIADGFHGEPTVGSVAISDYMLLSEFNDKLLNKINLLTEPPEPHFIVVAGSTSGGTGPGVIPVVSKKIPEWRTQLEKLQKETRSIEVSALLQLPWFRPIKIDNVDAKWIIDPDINLEKLQRNSASFVKFYGSELQNFADRMVLFGLPKIINRISAGPNRQPETRHYLNIISGWVAIQLFDRNFLKENFPEKEIYQYGIDDKENPLTFFSFSKRDGNITLKKGLDATRVMVLFKNIFIKQIFNEGKRTFNQSLSLPKEIYGFLSNILGSPPNGENGKRFLKEFSKLVNMDEENLKWFQDSCNSYFNCYANTFGVNKRDPDDLSALFDIHDLSTQLSININSIRPLLKDIPYQKHFLAADLLASINLDLSDNAKEDPEKTARTLYHRLRKQVFERLI